MKFGVKTQSIEVWQLTYPAMRGDSTDFSDIMLDCIEDAVQSVLGAEGLEALFVRLEHDFALTKTEIPFRLDVFFRGLERAFGEISGKTVGRFIVKVLYARLGLTFDGRQNRGLLDYVEEAKTGLSSAS